MELSFELICASVFTVFCLLLAFIYRHVCKLYTYFDKLDISGPVPSFLLGTWKEAPEKFLGDLDVENSKLYGKMYGTFDGLTPNLMVTEPDIIKQILVTHADKFNDRKVSSCRNPTLKKCLATIYGQEDREEEALSDTLTSDSKMKKLMPRFESSANTLVQNILKRKEEGVGFNFISIVNDYIHDLIALMVFGIDLNSDITFRDEFVSYCDQILTANNPNSKLSLIPLLYENLQGDSWILPQRALDYFVNLIRRGINDTPRDSVSTEDKAGNLIEILVEAAEEEKKLLKGGKENDSELILTEEIITVKCLSAILTLISTTKPIVLHTIQCLGNQLEVQEELSHEIGENKLEKLSISDLENLPILDMTIDEVMRLYPVEFRVEKVCKENVKIDKVDFVEGDRVSIPLFALHRQEDYYPEPEKFDPRRFSSEAFQNLNPFSYIPFAKIGVYNYTTRLALLASKVTIFKLIEKLQFKAPDNSNRVIFQKGITGVPKLAALNIITEVKNSVNPNLI